MSNSQEELDFFWTSVRSVFKQVFESHGLHCAGGCKGQKAASAWAAMSGLRGHGGLVVARTCRPLLPRLQEGGRRGTSSPGLTTSVVLLSILEYYAYSISPGQAAAHGGHDMHSGGHRRAFKQSCAIYSHNEPHSIKKGGM